MFLINITSYGMNEIFELLEIIGMINLYRLCVCKIFNMM